MASVLEQFQEVHKGKIEPAEVTALQQPERYVFGLYKLFKYFIGRISRLEEQVQSLQRSRLDDHMLLRKATSDHMLLRKATSAMPAVPPRDKEPQA